MVGIIIRSSH